MRSFPVFPIQRSFSFLSVGLALLFLTGPVVTANEEVVEYDPSVAGQLAPKEESNVQVAEEYLDINFWEPVPDLKSSKEPFALHEMLGMTSGVPLRVKVTARYRLVNPTDEAQELNLAFPIVGGGPEEKVTEIRTLWKRWENESLIPAFRRGVRFSVTRNGEPIEFEYLSFESLFDQHRRALADGVRKWLERWPGILQSLDGPANELSPPNPDDRRNPKLPREISPRFARQHPFWKPFQALEDEFDEDIPRLWKPGEPKLLRMMETQASYHDRIEDWDLDFLSFVNSFAFPDAEDPVAEALERWGVDDVYLEVPTGKMFSRDPLHFADIPHWDFAAVNRRLDFLTYRCVFDPHEEATIEVTYSHLVGAEIYPIKDRDNRTDWNNFWDVYQYTFQYLLKASNKWTHFGPIHLTLSIDSKHPYAISLPLRFDGREDGRDRYSYTISKGSEVKENLHVSIGGIVVKVEEDPHYPSLVDLRRSWDCYQVDPAGPFASAYLSCMAQKVRAGAVRSEGDYAFWCDTLEIDSGATEKTELDERIAERLLAMAAAKPPEVARKN
jgi:hypothetical protein